ncbi:uncharacterized protein [Amphiura filiformis]|uniref:uncharacterized protein n=1 Tax=Amphiura filiformis TaxID=82378 RepID=UPI003B228CF4
MGQFQLLHVVLGPCPSGLWHVTACPRMDHVPQCYAFSINNIRQDTTESKKEDGKDGTGKQDVPHDTAESKKEEEKDSSGKTDIHDTAESKKEEEKDSSGNTDIHDTAESKTEEGKDRSGKTGHVMISYSWGAKKDHHPCQQRMIKLRDELIAGGYRVWMDLDEMAGNMDDKMSEAVENAYAILMCVSENYQKSDNCKKEAQYAFFLKKPIVILKYDRHTPTGWLGLQINNLLYYDVQTEEAMMGNLPKIKEQLDKDKAPTKRADHDPESNKDQPPTRQTDPESNKDEDLIDDIAKKLRKHYLGHICKKQVYPWGGEWMDFDQIYIPVTIDRNVGPKAKPIKESLESYEELFKIEEDEVSRRFLLVGDPGQGKSSFCAKVAHDWCAGTTLQNIRLLFIIDLAKVDKDTLIEDAICEHLLSDIIKPTKLLEVIKHLKQSIFFIFDGLDEAPGLMSSKVEKKGGNRVADVMKNQKLEDCRVLVTTRPWGEKEMKDIPGYKRLELKKMTRENVKKYVKRFFEQDSETKSLGDSLVNFIDENKLTLDTSTPLIVLLVIYYWSETSGSSGIPDHLRTLYDNIISIMYKKQPQSSFTKGKIIEHLGKLAAESLTPYDTKIVFSEAEIKNACDNPKAGEKLLVQACGMGILCKKGSDLQFFHKSGQEFCAGVYLAKHNEDKLPAYLDEIESVQHALNLGMVLKFATSNKHAAKLVVEKLVDIFKNSEEPKCQEYYEEKEVDPGLDLDSDSDSDMSDSQDKVMHPVLKYDESRLVQQFIELILECNYEGQIGDEMRDSLKTVFSNGQVLFTGLVQKLVSSLSYYMSHCGEDVKQIHLHPIPHVKEKMDEIEKGAMRQVFADTVKAMEKRDISDLKRQCDRYVTANKGTVGREISDMHWSAMCDDHDRAARLAAYITCLEMTESLPSSNEIDFTPIINSLGFCPNLRLNCQEGYFGLANNWKYLLQQIVNDSINPRTLAVISELDASRLTDRDVCSNASDVTRVIKSIPKMINVHKLVISWNEFEPGDSSVLANSLTQCTQLQEFNMSRMFGATSSDMNTIFTGFAFLVSLRKLDISGNPLPSTLANVLTQCTQLQEFNMSYMFGATCSDMNTIFTGFTFLVSLRKLNISFNPLPNVDSVKCLRKCQALERIDLVDMKGEEDEMAALITTAGELPQLTTLDLSINRVINDSKCFSAIISILPHLRNLSILDLGNIKFTKEHLETLISTSRNKSMQKLT